MGLRGAFWGLALLSMLVAALAASGHLAMDGLSVHGYGIAIYGCLWGIAFFLAAMSEETLFRGYPFYTLARAIGFWPATILLSLVFGFVHVTNVGEATFGLASIVLVGVAFCLCLRLSGSLWWGIGFHAAWDWGQGFLFGTPVSGLLIQQRLIQSHAAGAPFWSGGTAGPEASVLILPTLLVTWMVIALTLRPRKCSLDSS